VILARGGALGVALALLLTASGHAATIPVPGTTARVEASGYVDGLAVAEIGGPRQRPQALAELSLLGKITQNLRTQLTLRGRAGGPFEGGHPGVMNLVHEFQNRSPSLEVNEAWAELRLGNAQVRAGIQKFAWGKLDGTPPTDVLTPRDLHDPLVRDIEESKIGIPAVQLTYYLPPVAALDLSELRASLVYIPIAVPARLALVQERWFPPSIASSNLAFTEREAEEIFRGVDFTGPVRVPVNLRTLNARAPKQLDAGGIAGRLGGTVLQMDWSVSHYTGPETGPNADLDVSVRCRTCPTAFPAGRLPAHVRSFLRQEHDIIHMTGADASRPFGGATVRAEVAVFQDRPYLRISRDLIARALEPDVLVRYAGRLLGGQRARVPLQPLFPDRDSVEWGIGADYLIEGFLPLVQVNQVIFTDDGPDQLLSNPETRILGSVRKRFLQDTLELEVRGVYAIERGAWFVYPRVAYRAGDHWRLRLGYLAVGGPLTSMIGQFHANDEFVLEGRYSF